MARKTIEVTFIVNRANIALASKGETNTRESRQGIIHMVEAVLHATGNYKGFSYLPSEYNNGPDSQGDPNSPRLRKGYDGTRRWYNVPTF